MTSFVACDVPFSVDLDGHLICESPVIYTVNDLALLLDYGSLSDFYALLDSVFSTPEPVQIVTAFSAAFTLPLICFVVSKSYGSIISFVR